MPPPHPPRTSPLSQFKHLSLNTFSDPIRIYYNVAEKLGKASIQPRSSAPIGLFGQYDGNIIGGSLLGAGMALSGSCPGTLFAQMAAGVHTGFYALNGAVIGGIIYTGFISRNLADRRQALKLKGEATSIHTQLGIPRAAAIVLFDAAFVAIIAATTLYTPRFPGTDISGAVGGLLIGLSQLFSLFTRRSMVGISGSYEEIGNLFWWRVKGEQQTKPKSLQNVLFAVSAGVGAFVLAKVAPEFTARPAFEATPVLATLGGALMVIGARLAGGCTSGHGISGISLLSTSSVITIASTFAAGSVVANLVY